MPGAPHLGVDFGTSHTVAVLRDGDTATPLLFDGSPLLPSAVYADDGRLLTGRDALHAVRVDPARCEPHPKRRVDDGVLLLGDTEIPITVAWAAVLDRVRHECLRVAGTLPPTTLTHPAAWGTTRRASLKAAAAAFGAVDMLPEPVAAARCFTRNADVNVSTGSGAVVFDLGGGTLDVSVVQHTPDGFVVLAVDGADDLGGIDIDHRLLHLVGRRHTDTVEWPRLLAPETPGDRRLHRALLDDVRSAKEQLSRHSRADLIIPLLDDHTHLTRDELESVTAPLLHKAVRVTTTVMRAAGLPPGAITEVFLVGGAGRMPLVATMLHRETGIAPTVLDQPELVVAHGAALGSARPLEPASAESVPRQTAVTGPRLAIPLADSPPATMWAARAVLALQTVTLLGGLVAAVADRTSSVTPWFAVMLVLAVVSAGVTMRAHGRLTRWTATGAQYTLIAVSYAAAHGGVPSDDPAILLVPVLLTAVCAVPLLHSGSSWFARIRPPAVPLHTRLTRWAVHVHFGFTVFTVVIAVALLGFAINDHPGYAQWLLALHIVAAVAVTVSSWALAGQPLTIRHRRIGLTSQYGTAAVMLLALATGGGIDHSGGLALVCLPVAVTIPLTHALKPSRTA